MYFPPFIWFVTPYQKPSAFQNSFTHCSNTHSGPRHKGFSLSVWVTSSSKKSKMWSAHEAIQTMPSPQICSLVGWSGDVECQENDNCVAGLYVPNTPHGTSYLQTSLPHLPSTGDPVVMFLLRLAGGTHPMTRLKTCNNLMAQTPSPQNRFGPRCAGNYPVRCWMMTSPKSSGKKPGRPGHWQGHSAFSAQQLLTDQYGVLWCFDDWYGCADVFPISALCIAFRRLQPIVL